MTSTDLHYALAVRDRSRLVPLSACRVFLRDHGDPARPPVLLLHGILVTTHTFLRVIPELARELRVLAPDLPGAGDSDRPPPVLCAGYSARWLASTMQELLDAIGVERVDVVGHSWGGAVAVCLADAAPERVRRLVLVDPTLFEMPVPIEGRLAQLPGVGPYVFKNLYRRAELRRYLGRAFSSEMLVDEADVDLYWDRLARSGGRDINPFWSLYAATDEKDPRGLIGEVCAALGLPEPAIGGATIDSAYLAARVQRYLVQHPYVETLTSNAFNAGRAGALAEVLLALQRNPEFADLRYDIRLFVLDPAAPSTGEALLELLSPDSGTSAKEADAFSTPTNSHLHSKLRLAIRAIKEFRSDPDLHAAHLSFLFDLFPAEEIRAQLPDSNGSSACCQPSWVLPLRPAWPSWMPIFAPLWPCTKSTMRLQASRCASFHSPAQPGVMRASGGGHLSACAAKMWDSPLGKTGHDLDKVSARPNFAALIYPVITMEDPFVHKGSRRALFGNNHTPEQIEMLSVEKSVRSNSPPFFIVATMADKAVPVENSLKLYQALRDKGGHR